MKKKLLAFAMVMLMFPVAILFTACGGGLQTGVNYVFDRAEVSWASNEEKELFLTMTEMTEEEFLAGLTGSDNDSTVKFNEDGTVTSTYGSHSITMHYVVEGDTVKVYRDAEKTQESGSMKIVGNTLVQEDKLEDGMNSTVKLIYKVQG